ncbi:MAG: hypothetical protein Q4B18_06515 [Bacillota bacterium]|nr:hypothetical protein [Bacillota bacterium]
MRFNEKENNTNLITRLDNVVKEDKISHAYIFEGSGCLDKRAFAESFVKGILCSNNLGENCGRCSICDKIDHDNHEDIIHISAEGGSIKDEKIVEMQEKLKTKPFGDRNVVVISDCDTMTVRAQNRLLKTLEEPPGKTVIILLSENIENLVQTIQSRCVKYRINYFGSDNYDSMLEKANKVVKMSLDGEPFYKIKNEVEDIIGSAEETAALLDGLQVVYRNLLMNNAKGISIYKDDKIMDNIHAVEKARKQIKEGVSPVYALKNLLLVIGG